MSQPPYGPGGNDPNQGFQPGGYGPNQGYGAPSGYPQGGYPGPGGYGQPPKSNINGIIAVIVAAVLVVGGGLTAVVLLNQDDEPAPVATTESSSDGAEAVATPSSAADTTASASEETEGETATLPPLSGPESDLLALVPADFRQSECESAELAGDGDIAHLLCGASQSQPGPMTSSFYLYESGGQVRDVFFADMESFGLSEVIGFECVGNAGYSGYSITGSDAVAGFYSCRITDDGFAVIQWSFEGAAFYGLVTRPGGQAALDELFEWWMTFELR